VIKFERYPHIQDLFEHYLEQQGRDDVKEIMQEGVKTENDAELISTPCCRGWDYTQPRAYKLSKYF
jgi:hypothetical protein